MLSAPLQSVGSINKACHSLTETKRGYGCCLCRRGFICADALQLAPSAAWANDLEPKCQKPPQITENLLVFFYDFKTDILTIVMWKDQQWAGCVVHLKEKKMERNLFSEEVSEDWRQKTLAFKKEQQTLSDLESFMVYPNPSLLHAPNLVL